MDLLELADQLFTGERRSRPTTRSRRAGELAEVQPGARLRRRVRQLGRGRHRRRPGRRRHERRVPRAGACTTRSARWSAGRLAHRGVHARPHRPRLRRRPLRGGGAHQRLGAAARRRARAASRERFDRYRMTAGLQRGDQPAAVQGARACGGRPSTACPTRRTPTRSTIDGRRRDVRAAPRPRRDRRRARGCGSPARKVLFTGDMFIWASPNCGNPQKVQRYAADWAIAFRKMAALDADVLLPGPRAADRRRRPRAARADRVGASCSSRCVEQTLALMNEGARLDDIVHTVRAPAHLLERPYLHAGLRRARVRRAQPLAALRRLVRRQPVAPEARAGRRARPRDRRARRRRDAARRRGRSRSRPRATCGSPVTSPSWPRRPRPTTPACTRRAPRCSAPGPAPRRRRCRRASSRWAEHESHEQDRRSDREDRRARTSW